jgi:hypothetical protein
MSVKQIVRAIVISSVTAGTIAAGAAVATGSGVHHDMGNQAATSGTTSQVSAKVHHDM